VVSYPATPALALGIPKQEVAPANGPPSGTRTQSRSRLYPNGVPRSTVETNVAIDSHSYGAQVAGFFGEASDTGDLFLMHKGRVAPPVRCVRAAPPAPGLASDAVLDRMAARLKARPDILDRRREIVEHPFGSMWRSTTGHAVFMTGSRSSPIEISLLVRCRSAASLVSRTPTGPPWPPSDTLLHHRSCSSIAQGLIRGATVR
jgi:hypothetical protein